MINMEETNKTIDYYNSNAAQYFSDTVNVNMSECCDRFLKYVIPGGRIIDVGAGSGRDIKYFLDRGYVVEGIDASEEMCRLASDYTGVKVICEKIQKWYPQAKYDGIWASACLLHLSYEEINNFIFLAAEALNDDGVIYISMKEGIDTGFDSNGRFFVNFSKEILDDMLENSYLKIKTYWETEDIMHRDDFIWINAILQRDKNRN